MVRFSFLILLFFTSLSAAFAQMEESDTTFLAEIDSILNEYEKMEKQRKVEEIIKAYDEKQLEREMSFKFDGALHFVRGLLLTWTDDSYIKRDARFKHHGDAVNWADYAVGGIPLAANWALKSAVRSLMAKPITNY